MLDIDTFLVDLDGVILHREGYFSDVAKRLYPDAHHEAIKEFFVDGTYRKTILGELDLEEAVAKALPKWNIDLTAEQLLSVWFTAENTIDQMVLGRVQELRQQGVKCIIATDHSLYRKNDVWEELGMNKYFDGIIASSDVHATKHEPEFYIKSMAILGCTDPTKILFTDDDPENVVVAESLGIKGIVFTGLESLMGIHK